MGDRGQDSNVDLDISSGQCYAGPHSKAGDNFIPCGNADGGAHLSCCNVGDNCLAHGACYHGGEGLTYIAGCTDPDFKDIAACQNKGGYQSQQWVGLVRCDGVRSGWWAGCEEEPGAVELDSPNDHCTCTASRDALFSAGNSLDATASLPHALGDHISWFSGHTPTATTAATTTAKSPSPSTPASSNSAPSSVSTDTAQPTSPGPEPGSIPADDGPLLLSTSAKVGIGVAAAVAALLLACLVYIAVLLRRRRRNDGNTAANGATRNFNDKPEGSGIGAGTGSGTSGPPNQDQGGSLSSPDLASGFKSELPADMPNSPSPPRHDQDLAGTGSSSGEGRGFVLGGGGAQPLPLRQYQYQAYNPDAHAYQNHPPYQHDRRYSNVSELSSSQQQNHYHTHHGSNIPVSPTSPASLMTLSPQNTGDDNSSNRSEYSPPYTGTSGGQPPMSPIAELPG